MVKNDILASCQLALPFLFYNFELVLNSPSGFTEWLIFRHKGRRIARNSEVDLMWEENVLRTLDLVVTWLQNDTKYLKLRNSVLDETLSASCRNRDTSFHTIKFWIHYHLNLCTTFGFHVCVGPKANPRKTISALLDNTICTCAVWIEQPLPLKIWWLNMLLLFFRL